jgi:3-oxoadipate enol-lactonase
MPTIEANGIKLYYELHGSEDGEVIVLSNGIMMSTAAWTYQTRVLLKHMRVLLYDCRGMWQSDHPEGPYSMEQHADDLAALLKALNIASAHIAGISYGSEVSMAFAIQYPEMTKSLVVIDGVSEVDAITKANGMPWLIAAERRDPELLLRTSVALNYSNAYIEANQVAIEASVPRFALLDLAAFENLMHAFFNLNLTEKLSNIKAPTMIVVAEDDRIKGRKYSKIIADQIKQAEFVVVPGSGHALCLEKPETLNTLLIGWVLKTSTQTLSVSTKQA